MTPLCPVCKKSMEEHGRTFECEACRQIIIFFSVSDASPYLALAAFRDTQQHSEMLSRPR
jgi:tRNA(Ile2) C34 agmatinyltransferase TiaS